MAFPQILPRRQFRRPLAGRPLRDPVLLSIDLPSHDLFVSPTTLWQGSSYEVAQINNTRLAGSLKTGLLRVLVNE